MNGVNYAGKGIKKFIYCTITFKRGQKKETVLKILEKNLIRDAFIKGHSLINIHGGKIQFHTISFTGNRDSENLFGRKMLVQVK